MFDDDCRKRLIIKYNQEKKKMKGMIKQRGVDVQLDDKKKQNEYLNHIWLTLMEPEKLSSDLLFLWFDKIEVSQGYYVMVDGEKRKRQQITFFLRCSGIPILTTHMDGVDLP